jgi:hypothetical protein
VVQRRVSLGIAALGLALLAAPGARRVRAAEEPRHATAVALSSETRAALEPLGEGVVGEALPAAPITRPPKLYHLQPGHWEYRIVAGANRGHVEKVQIERVASDDRDATWQIVTNTGDLQQFKVTRQHEVVKLAQEDADSDRLVVYQPGLVLDPGMQVGQSKTVDAKIRSYKRQKREEVEYDGKLTYTTSYLGAYRVTTPAGRFDARLLRHEYDIKIGPAKSHNVSYSFYADGVGNVAEVARDDVSAVLVYRRKTLTARVLLTLPSVDR